MSYYLRDSVTVQKEQGEEVDYFIEALFDVDDESYALIRNDDETLLMKIEEENGEQFLVGVEKPDLSESILDAYQIAVIANPADQPKE
ncbi:DUF1292 domain-containing protein [Caldifermentibacillus hisashii]|uniref:DUF1292 domain-containing protein n=1 Tax=Caldifermentibacillus hisashii TaxID=996558 RepID=UPI000BA3FCDD|nr:DUF1292 domain-containing protein [Caldifermentibacillus hisashii]PAC37753.1 DUF1292 domain-containing protein [Caldifermentibacillus hisashii]